jgi:hypothetical protein
MPTVLIRDPAGAVVGRLNAPEGASQQQIAEAAQRAFAQIQQPRQFAAPPQPLLGAPPALTPPPPRTAETTLSRPQAAQAIGEFAKREALPIALSATLPLAGPAGVAARSVLAGTGALGGRSLTSLLRGQPQPTAGEAAAEFLGGAAGEAIPVSALLPKTSQRIVTKLGREAGVRPALAAGEQAAQVGAVLRRSVGDLRGRVSRNIDALYNRTNRLATARGLTVTPSPATIDAVDNVLASADALGFSTADKLRITTAAQRLKSGQPLAFEESVQLRRALGDLGDSFAKTLGRGPRNPINAAAAAIKADTRAAAAQSAPVARAFERADEQFINEFLPTTRALRNIDAADPEDVVHVLAQRPGRLRRVLSHADPAVKQDLRGAWFADAIERSRDANGVADPAALAKALKALKPASRRILVGDSPGTRRAVRRLEEFTRSQKFQETASRLAVPAAGVSLGAAAGFATGDVTTGLAVMLGTAAGTRAVGAILANDAAQKLFVRGLQSTSSQTGARLIVQAAQRAGVSALLESQAPSATEGAVPASALQQLAQPRLLQQ